MPLNNVDLMQSDKEQMLGRLNDLPEELSGKLTQHPDNWDEMTDVERTEYLENVQKATSDANDRLDKIENGIESQKELHSSSRKSFNFKNKTAQLEQSLPDSDLPDSDLPDSDLPDSDLPDSDAPDVPKFSGLEDFQGWINSFDNYAEATVALTSAFARGDLDAGYIKDSLQRYFESDDSLEKDSISLSLLKKVVPDGFIEGHNAPESGQFKNIAVEAAKIASDTTERIKAYAKAYPSIDKRSPYNFRRHAQHKTHERVIEMGPDSSGLKQDQFTQHLISDWHLIERNKGFGFRLPGIHNIDWEKAWRENIMDKYTPAVLDKDGNYSGGYMRERFEVDEYQPESNRLWLKPGEKRRPVVPEHGNIGSRLEANRDAMDTERGYKRLAFNAKKKKEAQLPPMKDPFTGEKTPSFYQNRCSVCNGTISSDPSKQLPCKDASGLPRQNCPGSQRPYVAPSGAPGLPDPEIQKNQVVSGVFYNGKKFVVFAESGKKEFENYDQAVDSLKKPESSDPTEPSDPTIPHDDDAGNSAEALGIDR